MYRNKKVGVVVPAYNEEAFIGSVISGMPDYVDRIYIVDDGSTDRTVEIARSFNDPRISIISHSENKGVGAAIVRGYKEGLKDGMDLLAVLAGDNQMDPLELPRLLNPVARKTVHYSKGDRLSSLHLTEGMSRWRKFGNYLLTFLTRISSGYWDLQDPQNGYTVISREALEKLDLEKIYPWYGYCNDILVKLNLLGFSVMDVPIPARYGEERSKIRYGKYIRKVSWLLLRNFLWRIIKQYVYPVLRVPGVTYLAGLTFSFLGLTTLFFNLIRNTPLVPGALVSAAGILLLVSSMIYEAFGYIIRKRDAGFL
ncbi:MAG: glycosyltransferase family 2 protein [Clostridia bacterium]|nr:glycosyltransferase family 2 protein [Clostridia bacterium]